MHGHRNLKLKKWLIVYVGSSKWHESADSFSGLLNSWHNRVSTTVHMLQFSSLLAIQLICVSALINCCPPLEARIINSICNSGICMGLLSNYWQVMGSFPALHVPAVNGYRIVPPPTLSHHPLLWYSPAQAPCPYVQTNSNNSRWNLKIFPAVPCGFCRHVDTPNTFVFRIL